MKFSDEKLRIVRRYADEIAKLPSGLLEEFLRKRIAQDTEQLKKDYPELFRRSGF